MSTDPYYDRPEVSNSMLTWLKKYWQPQNVVIDLEKAYRFGSLIDAMITEACKVDYFKLQLSGVQYTKEEFDQAEKMKKVFFKDTLCKQLAEQSSMQKVSIRPGFRIKYGSFEFMLDVRCKWDFYVEHFDMCGDLKSTACTTQKQFEDSISHFDYDRQAAFYMDIENKSNFIFIGISKVNFKIFKVPVKRDSEIYRSGRAKYEEIAFKYWYLFGDLKAA